MVPAIKRWGILDRSDKIESPLMFFPSAKFKFPFAPIHSFEDSISLRYTIVYLREILSSNEWIGANGNLNLALGKNISGDSILSDLSKMPHLLIAGTTGSGKSVAINTMIISLLYKHSPNDVRMLMIDLS